MSKKLIFQDLNPALLLLLIVCLLAGCSGRSDAVAQKSVRVVVASDTILSGMLSSLLPPKIYSVVAILPPGQCPGHYDVKLSDVEKIKRADLIVSFKEMSFINKNGPAGAERLVIDTEGHNWMAPDSYLRGLEYLAGRLSKYSPEDRNEIMSRLGKAANEVRACADSVKGRIRHAGIAGRAVIASSMQKGPLEWMGFRVVGEYGRPESLSAREVVRLSKTGKEQGAIFVADNLQSGPDAGKGIAESLGIPHIVLTNFPSEKGYLAALEENVEIILAAAAIQKTAFMFPPHPDPLPQGERERCCQGRGNDVARGEGMLLPGAACAMTIFGEGIVLPGATCELTLFREERRNVAARCRLGGSVNGACLRGRARHRCLS